MKLVVWSAIGLFAPGLLAHVVDCRARPTWLGNSLSAKYYCHIVSSVCDASAPPGRISQNLRHQETQPRIKLYTEGLVIPSIWKSFRETSESERQTVVSARESATALRSAGNHSLCLLKNEVMRLTKEVAEQSTKKIEEGNSSHHSSVPVQPPGMACSQPFTPTEQVDSSLQTSRLAEAIP